MPLDPLDPEVHDIALRRHRAALPVGRIAPVGARAAYPEVPGHADLAS